MVSISCSKTDRFKIQGEMDASTQCKSMTVYNDQGITIATAPVVNGKFTIEGTATQPIIATIGNADEHLLIGMILENATYKFTVKDGEATLSGGPIHDLVYAYQKNPQYVALMKEYAKLFADDNDIDMENEAMLTKLRDKSDSLLRLLLQIEQPHLGSIIDGQYPASTRLMALCLSSDYKRYPTEKRLALFDTFEKELGKHPDIDNWRQVIKENEAAEAMQATVQPGNQFKELLAHDQNGKTIKLSEVVAKNKFTILEFWASWCGPCRAEIPNLKKAYDKYKSMGLEIVSVSIDEQKESWLKALKDEGPTPWINCIDQQAFKSENVKNYGISGIPSSFLISKDGVIMAINQELREFELDRTLAKFFEKK